MEAPVRSPETLLEPHARVLARIRAAVGVPDRHWARLHEPAILGLADLVQALPASEAHHHAEAGGLLRHALEVAEVALQLRQGALLPPGASADELARAQDLWTYACLTAALLHDVAKPVADLEVMLLDGRGEALGPWSPLLGSMRAQGAAAYRARFRRQRRHRRHERLGALLAHHVVPAEGLRWLGEEPAALEAWLAAVQGDLAAAGPLGELVAEADRISVARDLAGAPPPPAAGRAVPLARRLAAGLGELLRTGRLPLNAPGAAGFLTEDALWLVSKRTLDALREHLLAEGQPGIPSRNERLMDELQQHGLLVPNGGRAVWLCEVAIGEWRQRLTLLRFDPELFWPDGEGRPAALEGAVTPVAQGGGAGAGPHGQVRRDAARPQPMQPDEADEARPGTASPACGTAGGAEAAKGPPGPSDAPGRVLEERAQEAPSVAPPEPPPEAALRPSPASGPGSGLPAAAAQPRREAPETSAAAPTATHGEGLSSPFLDWLRAELRRRGAVNTPEARLHVLEGGTLALVTPAVFRDFDPEGWRAAQKRFCRLGIHRRHPDGTNVWTCRVAGERYEAILKVMLIPDAEAALGVPLPPPNRHVELLETLANETEGEPEPDGAAAAGGPEAAEA